MNFKKYIDQTILLWVENNYLWVICGYFQSKFWRKSVEKLVNSKYSLICSFKPLHTIFGEKYHFFSKTTSVRVSQVVFWHWFRLNLISKVRYIVEGKPFDIDCWNMNARDRMIKTQYRCVNIWRNFGLKLQIPHFRWLSVWDLETDMLDRPA